MQVNPDDLENQDMLAQLEEKVRKHEERKLYGQQLRSRLKWQQVGDKCSKEFFGAHKHRLNTGFIMELEDAQRIVTTDQAALVGICHEYYQKLYKARTTPIATEGVEFQVLDT